ncbi:hypothetical protein CgunFtcFv8_003818 [Champsocephalus gunnari]|uniref:Mitochondrial ribosomal protein S30 n=1 Tax=Champsocephalus gunnari TaxID=52237 RepID=A0AAN8E2J1_CHAGU|nr:hypothetical protein CgunFtcFv8_003818 [Champsocephalus gunnari]
MAARTRLPLLFPKNLPPFRNQRLAHTEAAVKEPAYPPIIPSLTAKSKSARGRQVDEQTFARNADTWYQHFTKTAYIPGLPEKYTLSPGGRPGERRSSRPLLRPQCRGKQEQTVGPFLRNLVTGLSFSLAKYNPLFLSSSLDIDPNVHFYWRRGQTIIPKGHRRGRQEPTRFQIDDRPNSQIRITEQLPQFISLEDSYAAEVQEVTLSPSVMPLFRRQYDNNMFTGAKLPDPACYGHTQFHLVPDRYHRDRMARLQQSDQVEVFLRANALTSLFAWTGAQAMYQGFWNHEDVTRPFVSQAVITDGKFFSFFCYQLNTVALSVETDANNPRKNLLWGTESLRLYDSVQDGEVVGLNDDVLKLLVQFLMNKQ